MTKGIRLSCKPHFPIKHNAGIYYIAQPFCNKLDLSTLTLPTECTRIILASHSLQLLNAFETCSNKMKKQVAKFNFQVITRFMMFRLLSFKMIYVRVLLPIWGPKTHYFLEKFLCFLLTLTCSKSHITFSSLATYRSFCEVSFSRNS